SSCCKLLPLGLLARNLPNPPPLQCGGKERFATPSTRGAPRASTPSPFDPLCRRTGRVFPRRIGSGSRVGRCPGIHVRKGTDDASYGNGRPGRRMLLVSRGHLRGLEGGRARDLRILRRHGRQPEL